MNHPLSADFQTLASWGIVVITAAFFLKGIFKKRKQSCGGGCGCQTKKNLRA